MIRVTVRRWDVGTLGRCLHLVYLNLFIKGAILCIEMIQREANFKAPELNVDIHNVIPEICV